MKGRIFKSVAAVVLAFASHLAHAGTVTYVYTDPQGTPLAEANASGAITATFDYKPYGSQALGSPKAGPGYTGHVNDPDTGFVYMQARYYDPVVGRFLSVDPVGPGPGDLFHLNRFNYANNNPVFNMDPDGRSPGGDNSICMGNMQCISSADQGGGGAGESTAQDHQVSGSDGCDESCQIEKDYDRDFPERSRQVVSTAQQIAGALSSAMEEGYYYLAADGLFRLGPLSREVEGMGVGFRSFRAFKRAEGAAGPGMDWHHIVEQTPGNIRQFGKYLINSEGNLIRLNRAEHARVSAFYSSKQLFTGGKTVREWLSGQSFEKQLSFGKQVLWRMGINAPE